MKIYLIRHAKSEDAKNNVSQRLDSSIIVDKETSSKIEKIKKKLGQVDSVFCSPMQRAKETADLIFGVRQYKELDYIQEYKTPNEIIGKPREVAIDYWEKIHKIDKMDINWQPEGGESFLSIVKRVRRLHKFLIEVLVILGISAMFDIYQTF